MKTLGIILIGLVVTLFIAALVQMKYKDTLTYGDASYLWMIFWTLWIGITLTFIK